MKCEIARRFLAGETAPALAVAYGTKWHTIRKFLKSEGARRLRSDGEGGIVALHRKAQSAHLWHP